MILKSPLILLSASADAYQRKCRLNGCVRFLPMGLSWTPREKIECVTSAMPGGL